MFNRKFLLTVSVVIFTAMFTACSEAEPYTLQGTTSIEYSSYAETPPDPATEPPVTEDPTATDESTPFDLSHLPPEYSFGDHIVLGSFVLIFNDAIEWTSVTDEGSQHYGNDVFRIPVEIMNVSHMTENPNMLDFYTLIGPNGALDNISGYFMEYDMMGVGSIVMGASAFAYFHFLYDGNGLYYVMFDFGDWEMPVRFPIFR